MIGPSLLKLLCLGSVLLQSATCQASPSTPAELRKREDGFQVISPDLLSLGNIDTTCRQVLQQSINCDSTVAELGTREYHGALESVELTDAVCATSCQRALNTAQRRIRGACGEEKELLPGMKIVSFVDSIVQGWAETCLKDEGSGEYCNDIIERWDEYENLEAMPRDELCSYCYGAKLRLMQSSEYSVYDEFYAAMLEHVNQECDETSPTNPIEEPPQLNTSQPDDCYSGKRITTQEGADCNSIALEYSISGASLYYINPNLLNCSSIDEGTDLCLPQTCTTHTAQQGESCVEIAVEYGTPWMKLVDWNLMLDSRCANLQTAEPYWGNVICVSPPGGEFEDGGGGGNGDVGNGDIGGEGGSGNGYSDTIVEAPDGDVAEGTTTACGRYVQAKAGVGCAEMVITEESSTPMDLFLEVNPSLGTALACDGNVEAGVWYCLSPHYGWDSGE